MATKKPKATITEIVARQNRLIDDAVGELRSDLTAMIGRVLPDVQSWLAGRLMVGGQDAVPPGPKSAATLRLLMRQINTGMKRAKLDARLEAWSDTFARQMPLFDEVLGLMGLPAMKWRDADIKWLANSKLSAEDQVRGVIESAAREVQTRALMQVSGLKLSELYRVMNERMQMAPATAASVADTSATIFLRSVHERGYTAIERDGDPLRFRFVGPHDKLERPFCDAVAHTGKGIDRQQGKRRIFAPPAAADGSYTREEIARMDNGQIPNAMLSGGGYRCRHQWIPLAIAPGPAAKPDPKVPAPKAEPAAVRPSVPTPPESVLRDWDAGTSGLNFRAAAAVRDLSPQQYRLLVEDHARKLLDQAEVVVRVKDWGMEGILKDGRYKNQLETENAVGHFDRGLRLKIDRGLFGVPEDTPPGHHPMYGFLTDDTERAWARRDGGATAYGPISLILKRGVRARTTFTDGDSLNDNRPWDGQVRSAPSAVDAPSFRSFQHRKDLLKLTSVRDIAPHSYVEAQVHGGLALSDIDTVLFDRKADLDRFRAQLEAHGLKVQLSKSPR